VCAQVVVRGKKREGEEKVDVHTEGRENKGITSGVSVRRSLCCLTFRRDVGCA
jgi:hypothetical protein